MVAHIDNFFPKHQSVKLGNWLQFTAGSLVKPTKLLLWYLFLITYFWILILIENYLNVLLILTYYKFWPLLCQ